MMEDEYVLVIGSAGMDVKGRPDAAMQSGMANAGRVRHSVGGVARNIAENLARLEVPAILLTAIGDDVQGLRVLDQSRAAEVNCDAVRIVAGQRTGTYLALLTPNGDLDMAISDYEVMNYVDADYLRQNEPLFADAALILIDATLAPAAIAAVFELAAKYEVRVCADPTTPALASRLCPYLDKLYFIVPNAAETKALCGLPSPASDHDTAIQAARGLVALGTAIAVVTMGDQGLAYADSKGAGFIRAQNTTVVDSTGAGDALTGAVIFALLNDVELDEAMRLGVTAAALTLQSRETVLPDLNQELLYGALVV
jgi:pseudouridine kinase